jgi:hypothetical protein
MPAADRALHRAKNRTIRPSRSSLKACEQHFGLRQFQVQITAIDPFRQEPVPRLRDLIDATRRYCGPDIFRFTLGGWLYADPGDPIWFSVAQPPASHSVACEITPAFVISHRRAVTKCEPFALECYQLPRRDRDMREHSARGRLVQRPGSFGVD